MYPNHRFFIAGDTFPAIRPVALIGIALSFLAAIEMTHVEISGWALLAAGLIFAQTMMPATETPAEIGNGDSAPEPVHESPRPGSGRPCPKCGWRDVRRSMPQGVIDAVVRVLGLVPYRCRTCGARFYRGRA